MGQLLEFKLAGTAFAVELSQLLEVRREDAFSPSPQHEGGAWIGELRLRGVAVPVYDLRPFLGLSVAHETRFFLLMQQDPHWAMAVEEIGGLLPVGSVEVLPLPEVVQRRTRPYYDHLLRCGERIFIPCQPAAWLAGAGRLSHG